MRIALVHIIASATHAPNHGLTSIAASLLTFGLSREQLICFTLDNDNLFDASEEIIRSGSEVVFISFTSNQLYNVVNLTRRLKELDAKILIVCGGHHITSVSFEKLLEHVDFQISGEVDANIGHLMARLGLSAIVNCKRAFVIDPNSLTSMSLPQIDIFPPELWKKYPSVIFSRGCPYSCSYCMSRQGGSERKVRWESPEKAIAKIEQLIDYAAPNEIYIDDDTLLKNHKWVERFSYLYKNRIKLPFFCNARPETVKPHLVEILKEAGCEAIGIGIESGSERIRRNILLRHMDNECIIRAFQIIKNIGLRSWSFNMVGIPTESIDDFLQTVYLNEKCGVDYVRVSIFTQFPGMVIPEIAGLQLETCKSYHRSLDSLNPELRIHVEKWLKTLAVHDKLWLTKSEFELFGLDSSFGQLA